MNGEELRQPAESKNVSFPKLMKSTTRPTPELCMQQFPIDMRHGRSIETHRLPCMERTRESSYTDGVYFVDGVNHRAKKQLLAGYIPHSSRVSV